MNDQLVGSIQALYRYPVKSMLGERHDQLLIDSDGIKGDRSIALIDKKSGKLVTAKQPVLWKAMLKLQASLREDGTTVVLTPSGEQFVMQDSEAEQILSDYLGRSVTVSFARTKEIEMERADPDEVISQGTEKFVPFETMLVSQGTKGNTFVDYGPIHLIATSSLDRVGSHALAGIGEADRFRPNILIDTELTPFCENDWIGGKLNIGSQVVLKVNLATPRCAIPTLEHGEISSDRNILSVLVAENKQPFLEEKRLPSLGVYAEVVSTGIINTSDEVHFNA